MEWRSQKQKIGRSLQKLIDVYVKVEVRVLLEAGSIKNTQIGEIN